MMKNPMCCVFYCQYKMDARKVFLLHLNTNVLCFCLFQLTIFLIEQHPIQKMAIYIHNGFLNLLLFSKPSQYSILKVTYATKLYFTKK